MKKVFFGLFTIALLSACAGGGQKAAEEVSQEVLKLEQSTEKLEEALESAEAELEAVQSEIDSLLNGL